MKKLISRFAGCAALMLLGSAAFSAQANNGMWRPVQGAPGVISGMPGYAQPAFRPLLAYRPYSVSQREMRGNRFVPTRFSHLAGGPPVNYGPAAFPPAVAYGMPPVRRDYRPLVHANPFPVQGGFSSPRYGYHPARFMAAPPMMEVPLFARQYGWRPAAMPWIAGPQRQNNNFARQQHRRAAMAQRQDSRYRQYRPAATPPPQAIPSGGSRYQRTVQTRFRPTLNSNMIAYHGQQFRPPRAEKVRRYASVYRPQPAVVAYPAPPRGRDAFQPFPGLVMGYPPPGYRSVPPMGARGYVPRGALSHAPYLSRMVPPAYYAYPWAATQPPASRQYVAYPEERGLDAAHDRSAWQACHGCGE